MSESSYKYITYAKGGYLYFIRVFLICYFIGVNYTIYLGFRYSDGETFLYFVYLLAFLIIMNGINIYISRFLFFNKPIAILGDTQLAIKFPRKHTVLYKDILSVRYSEHTQSDVLIITKKKRLVKLSLVGTGISVKEVCELIGKLKEINH